jgi:hypothetical protein
MGLDRIDLNPSGSWAGQARPIGDDQDPAGGVDMAEVVNLNKARKARARAATKAQSVENRAKFGRSKTDKAAAEAETRLADRRLDGHARED